MTDFRAMCGELLEELLARPLIFDRDLIDRARAALAAPPAAPEGKGPSESDVADLFYRHMGEGSEVGFENAIAEALARWGNRQGMLDSSTTAPAPAEGENIDRSHISDGYHTFAELYDHRHSLMLALMRAIPQRCWFSQRHADGELPFGSSEWFIAGAALPLRAGAITYHLPRELLSLAQQTGAVELSVGRPWDGHTPNDVIKRLRGWVTSPQPAPAVVPVAVSERLPGPSDCDAEGFCWFWSPEDLCWFWERIDSDFCRRYGAEFVWVPAHALPLPSGEVAPTSLTQP